MVGDRSSRGVSSEEVKFEGDVFSMLEKVSEVHPMIYLSEEV